MENEQTKVETKEVKINEKTAMTVPSKQTQIKDLLTKHSEQIQQALPTHIRADHFIRTALTCVNKSPSLLECTVPSLMGALLTAAQLGLMPDGVLGEAYLLPYNNSKKVGNKWISSKEVQFIPGYRGLVQLALRSGQVKSFQAREVYENDTFDYEFGLEPKLIHKPIKDGERGELVYVYAVVSYLNGGVAFEVMNINEIEYIRAKSKAPNSPAWTQFYSEMAKKTVIRKIAKMSPLSPEFNKAVGLDETADFLGSQKNDREVLNYEVDQSIIEEVEHTIETDTEEEKEIVVEQKAEKKKSKVEEAIQQSMDMIEKKKKGEDK
jgi:recombination protein RecT